MRVLFTYVSCCRATLSCAVVSILSYDSDDGCLWFWTQSGFYNCPISEPVANTLIRNACRDGFVDLSHLVFREIT